MNDYEFWNELGKIFNAVVAYQEKAVEFNKRFINPWIRLGNVFEKPLEHILRDPSLPRTVPGFVPYQRHGCDGCPPIMAKRMLDAGQ